MASSMSQASVDSEYLASIQIVVSLASIQIVDLASILLY